MDEPKPELWERVRRCELQAQHLSVVLAEIVKDLRKAEKEGQHSEE